ncbi:ABC transporter permease subunit [Sulfitobacter sp.]|uniref:ABC transporter permease n=1 Tax=Sulfitobacter sp. TaxID=1903071 RepID=UPI003299CFB6
MRRVLPVVIGFLLWELFARLSGQGVLITGPTAIGVHLYQNAGLLARASLETTQNAAWGIVWGNLVAVVLAMLVTLIPRSARAVGSLSLLVFCLPLVATGPILRVLYGPGNGPQITLAALAVFYTTFLSLRIGLRAIPQAWGDLVRLYGRGPWTMLWLIRMRAALPYLFVGLQIAAPAAFLGAMIGEFTGAERGLGVLTLRAMRGLDVDATWSLAVIAAAVSILTYAAVGRLAKAVIGYAPVVLLTPPRASVRNVWWKQMTELVLVVLAVLTIWQFGMDAFGLSSFFAKRPADVWAYLAQPDPRATLLAAFGETLMMTIPGYLAGLALGVVTATVLVLRPALSHGVLPLAVALRAVPIITTAPLIVLALGRGAAGTITIIAVMIFFPTLVACLQGLRQTPGQIVDVFNSYGAGRIRLLLSAQIPAMLPAFFASARMAVPAALLAVTTAEWLATGKGIGVLMALTASTSNYNMLWSCVALLSLAAVAGYAVVAWIERVVLRIYASEQVTG